MPKILYVHIGAHKTGTTAIQRFLSLNRKILIKKGYYYPGEELAHHFLPHSLKGNTRVYANPGQMTRELVHDIHNTRMDSIIISSEDFEYLTMDEIIQFKRLFSDDLFIKKIVFYVRRQDEQLESRYNQLVKGDAHYAEEFSRCILFLPNELKRLDYYQLLHKWSEVFGQENVIVRVYEKEQLPKGIFWDFLTAIDLEMNPMYEIPRKKENPSLNWDLIEMIRLCNVQMKKHRQFRFLLIPLIEILKKVDLGNTSQTHSLLSPGQKNQIIGHYDESNMKVAREYLSRPSGRLFFSSPPDSNETWEPYPGLTMKKSLQIFLSFPSAMFRLLFYLLRVEF